MDSFRCYYCDESTESYVQIIEHLCVIHKSEIIKYKQLELDYSTGCFCYRTKTFDSVTPQSHDVSVTSDNRIRVTKKVQQLVKQSTSDSVNIQEHIEQECNLVNEETETSTNSNDENDFEEIYNLMPKVIDNLKNNEQLDLYKKWCELVAKNQFPMRNICYLLFLDLIEWFSKSSSSEMRYLQPETLEFWRVGYKVFHGKFIRFMNGPRSAGQIIDGKHDQGFCQTADSLINFAVPSMKILTKQTLEPVFPGLLPDDKIKRISEHMDSKQVKICIDGKKIARGKGTSMGDIDCWGFEAPPTLVERKERLKCELELTTKIYKDIDDMDGNNVLPSETLLAQMKETIKVISGRMKDLRESTVKLDRLIDKFICLGEGEKKQWKKSRFAPVISSLKVNKFDTEQAIENGLRLISKLLLFMASFNGSRKNYSETGSVDLGIQSNYNQLKSGNDVNNSMYVKQRTEEWHTIRNEALVTGSTCNAALGLGKLKDLKLHYGKVIEGKAVENPTEHQMKCMEYGTRHEVDGVATVVGRYLPAYHPDIQYFEEGCMTVPAKDKPKFMVVSPDGSFRETKSAEPRLMFENKCKTHNAFTTDVFYKMPLYYIPQVLCEMYAYSCFELLFSCWSPQSTTVFHVRFDSDLWAKIWDSLCSIYTCEAPTKPTRFPENIKELRQLIIDYQSKNVQFVAEIPSCTAVNIPDDECSIADTSNALFIPKQKIYGSSSEVKEDEPVSKDAVMGCYHNIQNWQNSTYRLCRTTATEILVYMINDLDRQFHIELPNAHPIAYAMKGSSMTNDCFREMLKCVIERCEINGLDVLATSSDGQWHRYGVRDWDDMPLTMYQLQKDMWNREKRKTKQALLADMRNQYLVKSLEDITFDKCEGIITVFGHARVKKMDVYRSEGSRYCSTVPKSKTDIQNNETNDNVDEHDTNDVSESLLPHTDCNIEMMKERMLLEDRIPVANNMNTNNYNYDINAEGNTDSFGLDEHFGFSRMMSELEDDMSLINNSDDHTPVYSDNHTTHMYAANNHDISEKFDTGGWGIDSAYAVLYSQDEEYEGPIQVMDSIPLNTLNTCAQNNSQNESIEIATSPISVLSNSTSNTVEEKSMTRFGTALNCLQIEGCRKKWKDVGIQKFKDIVTNSESICKEMTKDEIIKCFNSPSVAVDNTDVIRKSWKKEKIANVFKMVMSGTCTSSIKQQNKSKLKSPNTLKKLAFDQLKQLSKNTLLSIVCEDKWDTEIKEFQGTNPCNNLIRMTDIDQPPAVPVVWFSKPHKDEKGKIRFHYTDSAHILTCLRTKICTTGITGLHKQAWTDAALSSKTSLNVAIVVECVDKQNVAFAKRVFGEDVEEFMIHNGFDEEARFVRLIREWFEAEDEGGIPAAERCSRRLRLRQYLLEKGKFSKFPYDTQYIGGIPVVTFEALLVHLERKIQIYQFITNGKGYNARALGSQEVEQFFSTVRDLDPSGLGTPKPDDIPEMIAKAAYLDNIRLNPDRGFHMSTSSATVYPEPQFQVYNDASIPDSSRMKNKDLVIRDNFFDEKNRVRVKRKRKSGDISAPDCPAKRQRGVRQYHVSDESKILPHIRKGLVDI